MGTKKYRPLTPSLRTTINITRDELTEKKPFKKLSKGKKTASGRDAGTISMRRRGGGHKQKYRIIDFKRDKRDIIGKIVSVEYDPNRSAFISLVNYRDGEKRYILSPKGIKVGDTILSGENAPIKSGCALPLGKIPIGTEIHNIEMALGRGGALAKAAGSSASIIAREGDYTTIQLPSGERRYVHSMCYATVGTLSNEDNMNRSMGKAGRNRWFSKRPKVRGTAMNPVDHPHGGGEGKTKGRHPLTPWGKPTKGYKTRDKNKNSSKFIIRRRNDK